MFGRAVLTKIVGVEECLGHFIKVGETLARAAKVKLGDVVVVNGRRTTCAVVRSVCPGIEGIVVSYDLSKAIESGVGDPVMLYRVSARKARRVVAKLEVADGFTFRHIVSVKNLLVGYPVCEGGRVAIFLYDIKSFVYLTFKEVKPKCAAAYVTSSTELIVY